MTKANLLASVLYQSAIAMKSMDLQGLRRKKTREKAMKVISMMQFLTNCISMRHISDEQTEIILSVLEHTYHYDISELSEPLKNADAHTDLSAEYDDPLFRMHLILSDGLSAVMRKDGDSAWRCMAGFHNFPRAFLSLGDSQRISPRDALEWSMSYFKLD